jgi:hypothetical protein
MGYLPVLRFLDAEGWLQSINRTHAGLILVLFSRNLQSELILWSEETNITNTAIHID